MTLMHSFCSMLAGVKDRIQLIDMVHLRLESYRKGHLQTSEYNIRLLLKLLKGVYDLYKFKPTKWMRKYPEIWDIFKASEDATDEQKEELWDRLDMDAVEEGDSSDEAEVLKEAVESIEDRRDHTIDTMLSLLELYKSGEYGINQEHVNKLEKELRGMLTIFSWRATRWFAENVDIYNKIMNSDDIADGTKLRMKWLIYLQKHYDSSSKFKFKLVL